MKDLLTINVSCEQRFEYICLPIIPMSLSQWNCFDHFWERKEAIFVIGLIFETVFFCQGSCAKSKSQTKNHIIHVYNLLQCHPHLPLRSKVRKQVGGGSSLTTSPKRIEENHSTTFKAIMHIFVSVLELKPCHCTFGYSFITKL